MQIGEQSVLVQKVHGDPQPLEHIVEFFNLLGKEGKDVLRLGHLLLAPLNDEFFDLLLPVFGRQEVQCPVKGGFVVDSRGEQLAAFGIHAARHGIGEIIRRRVCGRWRALRFKVEDIARLESCKCLMEAVRNDRQFLLHGGVKIRTSILPRRLQRSVLVDTDSNAIAFHMNTGKFAKRHGIRKTMYFALKQVQLVQFLPPLRSLLPALRFPPHHPSVRAALH